MPSKSTKIAPCFAFFEPKTENHRKMESKRDYFLARASPQISTNHTLGTQLGPRRPPMAPNPHFRLHNVVLAGFHHEHAPEKEAARRISHLSSSTPDSYQLVHHIPLTPMPLGTFSLFKCGQSPQSSIEARWRVRRVARWIK